jgi:hypothetical protein
MLVYIFNGHLPRICYSDLVYLMAIYILYFLFIGIFLPVLVCCTKKNLATVSSTFSAGHNV